MNDKSTAPENSTDKHHTSSIFSDVVIAMALTRSIYRDIKEQLETYTPESVQNQARPKLDKLFSSSNHFFKQNFPKAHHVFHAKKGAVGFMLSVVALGIHYQHLVHQYSHTGENIKHKAIQAENHFMSRYGHLSGEDIRKIVYNSPANRPY